MVAQAEIGRKYFCLHRGSPMPLGATAVPGGINFALFSRHANRVTLVLFEPGGNGPIAQFDLHPDRNRTGWVWHAMIEGAGPGICYGYHLDEIPNDAPHLNRFVPGRLMLDPYGKAVEGGEVWGVPRKERLQERRTIAYEEEFDWGADHPLKILLSESVIYEMHVRGFTRHASSGVSRPGTFAGLIEKIPYLKSLGVTAVELLPVNEFEEGDTERRDPDTGKPLLNFWGYQPICFFAPNTSYAAEAARGGAVREFKRMVKAFHESGIEVILDVVFNHTAEGDETGPVWSFRGIDNTVYYILDKDTGHYLNYSGCGNTVNCNHPIVRDLIRDTLRYWVTEMHVDGFRFDLASILGRGQDGSVLADPPILERLANDPILAKTKLIAEAWDAAGLYQVGTFPAWGRWAEWNGKFRDDVRKFVRGDAGMVSALATRLLGSADLYLTSAREPYHSINFITSHDGFTMADLVSYSEKHNERNGEDNHDGTNENHSWNHGVEGPTDDPEIQRLRLRQIRNFAAILMVSNGVPMMMAGDELGRTQQGNNNAYCQDNEIAWIDWRLENSKSDLLRFWKGMIEFRKRHKVLRRVTFELGDGKSAPMVAWHGVELGQPDWSDESRALAMHVAGSGEDGSPDHIYFIANAWWKELRFALPYIEGYRWVRFVDTALAPPLEIAEFGAEVEVKPQDHYLASGRSVVILLARPVSTPAKRPRK
jgi:isoamylase